MAVAVDIISRLDTGQKVSGVAHIALIAWVMLFDLFQAPDRNTSIPVTDVALISAEEFAALSAPASAPPPTPAPAPQPEPAPHLRRSRKSRRQHRFPRNRNPHRCHNRPQNRHHSRSPNPPHRRRG